jgi:uncharacterized membrane protein
MRWARHVASVRQKETSYKVLLGDLEEIYHLKDTDADGKIMLKYVLKK